MFTLSFFDSEKGRLGDVHKTIRDQLRHLAEEEREKQGADVCPIHIGVRHDNELVIPRFAQVKIVTADSRAQCGNNGLDLVVGKDLVQASLFDIDNFSLKWENGLEPSVASLFGRPPRRIALDQEYFAQLRLTLGAIRQLAGQSSTFKSILASSQVPSLARGFPSLRRCETLPNDFPGHIRILFEILG